MKKKVIITVLLISSILLSVFGIICLILDSQETFYVGVTYCGESAEEAKQLIDKVKDYTNLFFLQTGLLQILPNEINEIGDYAVSSGMNFMVYFGYTNQISLERWLETAEGRWNKKFLGVYYGDEPAGRMLDGSVLLEIDTQPVDIGTGVINATSYSYSL